MHDDIKYDREYFSSETDRLIPNFDPENASRTQSHASHQPELRKRISSVGGAIASESLYASPNVEIHHSNTNLAALSQPPLQPPAPSVSISKPAHELTFSDIPWCAFFSNSQALILFLCHWCYAFVGFILLTEIPAFLTEELDYDIESAGLLSIAPYAANFISTILFAMYFDRAEEQGWSARQVRQRAMQVTFIGSGGCLVICGFMKQRGFSYFCFFPYLFRSFSEVAYFFLILSLFFFGANHSGIHCAYLDVSPNFSSIMNTVGNTCGAVAGLTGPIMVSALTHSFHGSWGWQLAFLIVFAQCVFTVICWAIFQTSDIVPVLNTPLKRS
jgi:hypothetical protein